MLTTASGLVFAGDGDGNIMAFDSRTGKNLWHYQLGVADALDGGHDLHAGRPAVSARAVGQRADGVRAAAEAVRVSPAAGHHEDAKVTKTHEEDSEPQRHRDTEP